MFKDLIEKRRSIRKYKNEALKKEEIESIVSAGLYSPTAKNRKCLHFIIIEDKDKLELLSRSKERGASFLKDAACGIAVVSDMDIAPNTYRQDASIAAIMMQLQAEDLDIGSCWINVNGFKDEQGRSTQELVKEILAVKENYNVECILSLGYKDEEKSKKRPRSYEEYVHYEKF
jgi:nitroreductase